MCAVYDFKFEVTRLYCVLLFMCGYFVCLFFCVIGVRIVVCFLIGKICNGFNEFITDMPLADWAKVWCWWWPVRLELLGGSEKWKPESEGRKQKERKRNDHQRFKSWRFLKQLQFWFQSKKYKIGVLHLHSNYVCCMCWCLWLKTIVQIWAYYCVLWLPSF